jgi:hypothetical protein
MPQVALYYPGAGMGWRRSVTTHCARGHEYTPENTLIRAEGWRNCRTCRDERYRERRA